MVMNKRHVLDLDSYSKTDIESLLKNTIEMKGLLQRDIKKTTSLNGKTVVNIFLEASTRTRVSFERAAKILSADVINVSGSGSSIEKGRVSIQHGFDLTSNECRYHYSQTSACRCTIFFGTPFRC